MNNNYTSEIEMYPDIINWLKTTLSQKYKRAKILTVIDTHDSDLSNFIVRLNYEKFFPEYSTYHIRQDITAFIEYKDKVNLVFVECKNIQLSLIHLSQIIGYSCIAIPIHSFLISPLGLNTTLHKLLFTYNRLDILEFRSNKKISILKWDRQKQDIDHMESIHSDF